MFRVLLAALPLAAAAPAPDAATYEALRAIDLRMATIAHRLVTANAALCREQAPALGWAIHAVDQYPADDPAARAAFRFPAPVAVEAVVPGGPAARAGVHADDGVSAVAGRPLPAPAPPPTSATRDAALDMLAALPPDAPITLALARGGERLSISVRPQPGCRARFEVLPGAKLAASSDGTVVQLSSAFFERFGDADVAVVVAHELAHVVLRHRARLDAAGVSRGLLKEVGRNGRLFRTTESEADVLGAFLLRNAGYDAASAPRFWRVHGGEVDGGLLRSRTHPASRARADAIEAALAAMPARAPMPYLPPVLGERDRPLR
jgi:hypothetical protein